MSDPRVFEGECLCSSVRYRVSGEHLAMFLCHCSRCRKETGTIHGASMFLKDASIDWLRGEDRVRTYELPGTRKSRSFCSNCGSPLPRSKGTRVVLPAGGVETDLPFTPTAHIFCASRAAWEDALSSIPKHDELPS